MIEKKATQRQISRVLVANRGEIAVRIIRAAHELGIETVAVYSDPDQGTLPVRLATRAVALGGSHARDSYLSAEKLIRAAVQTGCDAVHPGYGFLAENAAFASASAARGLVFIGPTPETIALMGDKHRARQQALSCGVPVLPGTSPDEAADVLPTRARELGYPLMIKAVAGGSGRGMRVVQSEDELQQKLEEARREAEAAFSNGAVYLERYLAAPRHIEVQLFGDAHGTVRHLDARECSVQRRHQKLVEEAPAVLRNTALKAQLLEAAVKLGRSVNYLGAGTVEFLVETQGGTETAFYFLEMNTRIQVEHPVTEMITGVDLVKEQLAVACGRTLSFGQGDAQPRGHAFEFRVYGEDPAAGFKPQTGKVRYLNRVGGHGVREDSWVEAGSQVSPYYDSLLSKVSVWGRDRDEALARAQRVLNESVVEGMPTTLDFHRWLLSQPAFRDNTVDVFWIGKHYKGEKLPPHTTGPLSLPPPRDGEFSVTPPLSEAGLRDEERSND